MSTRGSSLARIGVVAALIGAFAAARPVVAQQQAGGRGPGGFPGGPPGMGADRPLVAKFDTDSNKRLDTAERRAARAWLASPEGMQQVMPSGMPPGMFAGGRGPGGPPGRFGRGGGGADTTPVAPGVAMQPRDVPSAGKAPLYDARTYRTIFLEFENADWEQELEAFNNTDVEVPAQVTIDGVRYRDVGVHFRGNSSYFMVPRGKKRSLNLSFDDVVDNQTVGGYRTLNLLNSANDPTFVRTVLYSHIANRYLPAPKANLVRVVINGESWGTYASQQQYNRDFLHETYGTTGGVRWQVPGSPGARGGMEYLGDSVALYRARYELKTKDDPARWQALIAMFKVLNTTPVDQLVTALSPLLDIDQALRFLAIDVALVNSDGYWTRASDYSIYQDTTGRFHVIPHDMNEAFPAEGGQGGPPGMGPGGMPPGPPPGMFPGGAFPGGMPPGGPPSGGRGGRGGGPMMEGGADLDPLVGLDNSTTPLRSKLLAVPALRAKYLAYVRQIAERDLDWKNLGPVVAQYQQLIAADVPRDTRKLYSTEAFTTGTAALKSFVEKRRAYLLKTIPETMR